MVATTPSSGAHPLRRAEGAVRTLHDFSAVTVSGENRSLSDFRGSPVLVVNTASECGFVSQYGGLQRLQETYGPQGFTVLAFPCNQFLRQEPGSDEEIQEFCRREYQVSFPVFAKVDVNGPDAHPLFVWLKSQKAGVMGGRIAWNFTKFLLDADGHVLRRYAPAVPPLRIARRIEQELAETGTPAPS